VRDRRCRRVYLFDRGGRCKCDGDAESNGECHKDEFGAHSAASHLHHRPADIWAAGTTSQTPGRTPAANAIALHVDLFPRGVVQAGASQDENARFHPDECADSHLRANVLLCGTPRRDYFHLTGTAAQGPGYYARAKSLGVPFRMAVILLLDLAFL
jgi:hypothetical protein